MDELLRCLRDGSIGTRPPPLALFQDSVPSIGGPAVASKAVVDLCNAVKQLRAQAKEVLCISLSGTSAGYSSTCKGILGAQLHVTRLDAHSDRALEELSEAVPLREPRQSGEGSEEPTTIRASTSGRPSDSSAAAAPTVAVIIDSLSSLLFLHPEHKVLELLDRILHAPSVSCVLATLHSDLHKALTVQALERMSACVAELMPPPEAVSPSAADVFLETRIKQRTGRVKVVKDCYQLLTDGTLLEVKPEVGATPAAGKLGNAPGGTRSEDASKEAAALAALAEKMGGGMRLTLTQQEAAARQNVVLPWEQRQNGAQSQDEFKEAAPNPGLGQIMYERDSETDPDSDEDPDDDLDF